MITITLKNIPRSVHKALKYRAKQHGRSLNKEALVCLEDAVSPTLIDVDALLADIQQHRSSLPGKLTDQLIREATEAERP
ncbi:MAG: Arc family DNA-binding protein [Kiritimatiellia bacterium]